MLLLPLLRVGTLLSATKDARRLLTASGSRQLLIRTGERIEAVGRGRCVRQLPLWRS